MSDPGAAISGTSPAATMKSLSARSPDGRPQLRELGLLLGVGIGNPGAGLPLGIALDTELEFGLDTELEFGPIERSRVAQGSRCVQKHVTVLERAGLVTKERVGRRKLVRTDIEGLAVARRLLDQYEELWRGRIDRMFDLIATDKETQP